ncbi:hypothetical protein Vadar_028768 [Vaccinium darrowii]|uniref:Uncharacterized protein n=1 Tax=Vaccinium darrowii TaxID=229202 RepID=A0ACB7ZM11_9ERIC|nr:hypothetical protein Vadar_028768 [Vaccinium darrowii]
MSATSSFVAMANQNVRNLGTILCPCKECRNLSHHSIENVYEHLVINGMDPTYTTWYHHGEHPSIAQKPREVELSNAYNLYSAAYALDGEHIEPLEERRDEGFAKSLEDAETPLYQGCLTYTKLSAIVTLYKLKTDNGWTDESFTDLLDKLHGKRTQNWRIVQNVVVQDGRWISGQRKLEKGKGIPRFQNMYRSSKMAENLKWHSTHGNPRNLRLGLATDGFNPFSNLSSTYSCWPVMLVTYNLPPWLWMKRENVLLALLIPGPKQPSNDIDVYLQPLIEDLQELWSIGISIYDKSTDSMFNLRAILLWTMNDFPTLGNLAGCKTKGKTACPICGENTCYLWLKFNKKMDLQNLGIRHDLHPQERGTKTYLPLASHTLSKAEKEIFCKRLFDLKVPDGYSSNIANCVSMEELKITGLISHDCHALMRQLLPIAVRGLLPKGPQNAILRLCSCFNKLCQRVIDREEIAALEGEVVGNLMHVQEVLSSFIL